MSDTNSPNNFDWGKSFTYFQKTVKEAGPAATASYTLTVSIIIFIFLGWYIDLSTDSSPWGVIIGLFFGLITGFYHLAKTIWKED
ncbi:MAG: hypothetical protein CMG57_04500 [Candidatus Marinimicrobia bacterium]|nr:hypothetical protein [Candidatus Neomarinimicrobiota bacterium]|tara:strand:- start:450 stop:704 length:255 start_codon:yes stop_codon:yes gene_type:complete